MKRKPLNKTTWMSVDDEMEELHQSKPAVDDIDDTVVGGFTGDLPQLPLEVSATYTIKE